MTFLCLISLFLIVYLKKQIGFIIGIQVAIIVFSFLVLIYFENQSTFLGNSINISGKNRFLAESLYSKIIIYSVGDTPKPLDDVIVTIDHNIMALSHGGMMHDNQVSSNGDIMIMAVPYTFSNSMQLVQTKWSEYKSVAEKILNSKEHGMQINSDLENEKSQFVSAADGLTYALGKYGNEQVSILIFLQLLLLAVNIFTHAFLLKLILSILQRDYVQKLLIAQVSNNNQKLSLESKMSLLQKDILESFLDDMKNDLQKLKNQIGIMDFPGKSHDNRFVFHEIMSNLSTRVEQLAESKKELDDNVSYYQKLNLNLAKSLSVISGSKNGIMEKTGDALVVIQSYIDGINHLVENQNIPAHLGKRVTNTMHEIIDGLEQLKNNE